MDGLYLLFRLSFTALRRLGHLVKHGLLLACVVQTQKLVLHAVDASRGGHAAVADGGVQLLKACAGDLFKQQRQHLLVAYLLRAQSPVFKLRLEHLLASDDVLLTALLFEPLLDLRSRRAAFCDVQPVTARTRRILRRAHLHDVAVLENVVKGDYPAVYRRTHHAVADSRVYAVGKVDGRRPCGKIYNVALR